MAEESIELMLLTLSRLLEIGEILLSLSGIVYLLFKVFTSIFSFSELWTTVNYSVLDFYILSCIELTLSSAAFVFSAFSLIYCNSELLTSDISLS